MKISVIVFFVLLSVSNPDGCGARKNDCAGKPVTDCMCTQQYDPVCGCDGKTYGNACVARCAGIKSWTKGECSTKQ